MCRNFCYTISVIIGIIYLSDKMFRSQIYSDPKINYGLFEAPNESELALILEKLKCKTYIVQYTKTILILLWIFLQF